MRLPVRVEVDKSPSPRASLCDSQRHARRRGPIVATPCATEGDGGDESETDRDRDGDGDAPTPSATLDTEGEKDVVIYDATLSR